MQAHAHDKPSRSKRTELRIASPRTAHKLGDDSGSPHAHLCTPLHPALQQVAGLAFQSLWAQGTGAQAAADEDALTATIKAVMRLACKLDVAGLQQRCPRRRTKGAKSHVTVQMHVA